MYWGCIIIFIDKAFQWKVRSSFMVIFLLGWEHLFRVLFDRPLLFESETFQSIWILTSSNLVQVSLPSLHEHFNLSLSLSLLNKSQSNANSKHSRQSEKNSFLRSIFSRRIERTAREYLSYCCCSNFVDC